MKEPHFMLDIETTGIDTNTNDLLQIGILALKFKNGYWEKGRSLTILQHTDMQPESEFSKNHMAGLFKACNEARYLPPEEIRDRILDFCLKEGPARPPDIRFMGWNAAIFDVPFLVAKGILKPPGYETVKGKDKRIGDFHYHIYDLAGSVDLVKNVLRQERSDVIQKTVEGLDYKKYDLPPGTKEHDALYDCISQLNFLNGMLRLFEKAEVQLTMF